MQFAGRTISRHYLAIVWGIIKDDSGSIIANIGRSQRDRKLFCVTEKGGKTAITDYEVIQRYGFATLLMIKLRTGRTHQIRVHFSNIKHPLLGDTAYGGNRVVFGGGNPDLFKLGQKCLMLAGRQMLHAKSIEFLHPATKKKITVESILPDDMATVLEILGKSKNDGI